MFRAGKRAGHLLGAPGGPGYRKLGELTMLTLGGKQARPASFLVVTAGWVASR
jgi:hypothetical protein